MKLSSESAALAYQLLQIVVEGAGPELVQPFGLPQHVLHDGVAVHIGGGKRQQDI